MGKIYEIKERDGVPGIVRHWHEGQLRAWNSTARFVVVLAGVQSGKTVFGPHWLAREIARTCDINGEENDYIAATANYKLLSRKMLPTFVEVFENVLGIGRYWSGDQIMELRPAPNVPFWAKNSTDPMWGRVLLGSAAAASGLESATARAAWTDEWGMDEVDNTAQDAIESRLAVRQGRQLVTTTAYNVGLIKIRFHDPWKGGDPTYDIINFESISNPEFPKEEFERQRKQLPVWRFDMRYRGLLTKPAGLIYEGYEDGYAEFAPIAGLAGPGIYTGGGNLVKAFTVPREWMRDVGVDFGESANCARLWVAEDPATHYGYVFRDQLGGGLNGPEYAQDALSYHEAIRYAVGGAKSEQERRDQWARAGLPVAEPLISEVEAGIDHLNALFKTRRWFVLDTCTRFRSELGTYSRELDAAGEPTAKIADKATFHTLDGGRYVSSVWPQERPEVTLPTPWMAGAEAEESTSGKRWY